MEVIHKIGLHVDQWNMCELAQLGVLVDEGLGVLEINETAGNAQAVFEWAGNLGLYHETITKFTEDELAAASYWP